MARLQCELRLPQIAENSAEEERILEKENSERLHAQERYEEAVRARDVERKSEALITAEKLQKAAQSQTGRPL